ncbi:CMRF35-like molecule 5 [Anabarilius grahami]|uniref:CMRF35-like molecule 5 n=1 Tax=Anabarilius grahami TaxID=495550 RepID=A0A3N0Z081_ANAGA|nr:CMRF35-like molecule 5 [Anabarilius grahami]
MRGENGSLSVAYCSENLTQEIQAKAKAAYAKAKIFYISVVFWLILAPDVSVVSSSVSGHEGGNVSVQCFYRSRYHSLKQWCRYKDQSCYTVNDTSQNPSVQISDDVRNRSFTVLTTGLRLSDSGWFWCSAREAMNPVHLNVTEAEPGSVITDTSTEE